MHKITKIQTLHESGGALLTALGVEPITDGYWIVGHLLETPAVGRPLRMLRHIRNGEYILGLFVSSVIVSITSSTDNKPKLVCTETSVYELEESNCCITPEQYAFFTPYDHSG